MARLRINEKQIGALVRLNAHERFKYALKTIAESKELWTLKEADGRAVLIGDETGEAPAVPIWPHQELAARECVEVFATCVPHSIALDQWLDAELSSMEQNGRQVAVFPIHRDGDIVGPVLTSVECREALQHFLDKWE